MQRLTGSQWTAHLAGKEREFARAKDKLGIFERVAPRLIAEARNVMRGKQKKISDATAELAGKIDPAIEQKAKEIQKELIIPQSKEMADLFKNHGLYLISCREAKMLCIYTGSCSALKKWRESILSGWIP